RNVWNYVGAAKSEDAGRWLGLAAGAGSGEAQCAEIGSSRSLYDVGWKRFRCGFWYCLRSDSPAEFSAPFFGSHEHKVAEESSRGARTWRANADNGVFSQTNSRHPARR